MSINSTTTAANDNTGAAGAGINAGAEAGVEAPATVGSEGVAGGVAAGGAGMSETTPESGGAEVASQENAEEYDLKGGIAAGAAKAETGDKPEGENETATPEKGGVSYDGLEQEVETPEGFVWDNELVDDFKGLVKADRMSREKAKKYGALGVKVSQKVVQNIQKAHFQQSERWKGETLKLPEFTGQAGASNIGLVEKAYAQCFSEETRQILTLAGLDNHPGFCRDLLRLGQRSREDTVVEGGVPGKPVSAERNYMNEVGFTPVE